MDRAIKILLVFALCFSVFAGQKIDSIYVTNGCKAAAFYGPLVGTADSSKSAHKADTAAKASHARLADSSLTVKDGSIINLKFGNLGTAGYIPKYGVTGMGNSSIVETATGIGIFGDPQTKFTLHQDDVDGSGAIYSNIFALGSYPRAIFGLMGTSAFGVADWPSSFVIETQAMGNLILSAYGEGGVGRICFQTARRQNALQILYNGQIVATPSTTNSSIRIGGIELQSYNVDYNWITNNIYYTTVDELYHYRDNGKGVVQRNYEGDYQILTAPTGVAGNAATLTNRFTVGNTGTITASNLSTASTGILYANSTGVLGAQNITANYLFKGSATTGAAASGVYDDAGKIGIGTAGPNFKLHISTGNSSLITQPTAGSYGLYVQQNTSGSSGGIYIQDGASNSGNALTIADNNGGSRVVVDGDGNVGIGTTAPSSTLDVLGTARFGDHTTNYSDFESDGTLHFTGTATVYNDVQFAISTGKVPAANYPAFETFTTNTMEYSFAVNDYIDLGGNEVFHSWKEGTAADFHLHIATKAANTSGSNRYAKFQIFVALAKTGGVYHDTTLTGEYTIPNGTAALTNLYLDMGDLNLSGYTVESQLKPRIKRIAATGGTEYSGNIFILQCGAHLESDAIGSRTEIAK